MLRWTSNAPKKDIPKNTVNRYNKTKILSAEIQNRV